MARPLHTALAALVLVALYHLLLAAGHQGNVTALFYAGDATPAPPALAGTMYFFPQSVGFDGQFYLYVAHDPLNQQGVAAYIDNPSTRWKRILLPGAAYLLALGQPAAIPYVYVGLMWLLTFLGTWLLGRLCTHWGYPAWWGIGFLAIPAVVVSLDRMMTDIGLVVALLALLLATRESRPALAITAMVLAPLARETGLVLAGAWLLWNAAGRRWREAVWGFAAALPFLAWGLWVNRQFGPDGTAWWGWPFEGILTRLATYTVYPAPQLGLQLALFLDYVGAWGIAVSFTLAAALFLRGERSLLMVTALLYSLGISVFAKEDMWGEAYSYTRTGGPVALLLAIAGLEQRRWWMLAPLLLVLPRIVLQVAFAVLDSLRGLGG